MSKIENPYTQRFWTRKKAIATFVIVGAVSLYAVYSLPLATYGQTFLPPAKYGSTGGHYTLYEANEPPVSYWANFTFSGIGALSLYNNIHFVAYVYRVNITDFTNHFIGIIFANSVFPATGPPNTAQSHGDYALFQPVGSGVWKAEGDMGFVSQSFTGPVLIPQWTTTVVEFAPSEFVTPVSSQIKAYNFNLPLQSQDVTNGLVAQMTTIRWEAMLALIAALVAVAVPVIIRIR
jgi:hypothetical protein